MELFGNGEEVKSVVMGIIKLAEQKISELLCCTVKVNISFEKKSPELVFSIVSEVTGIPIDKILNTKYDRRAVEARRLFYFFMKWPKPSMSNREMGLLFKVDHSVVWQGEKEIKGFLDVKDERIVNFVTEIKERLLQHEAKIKLQSVHGPFDCIASGV